MPAKSKSRDRRLAQKLRAISVILIVGILLGCLRLPAATVFDFKPEWALDFGEPVVGSPALLGGFDQSSEIVITLNSGKIVLVSPEGKKGDVMMLDLPVETSAVAGDLRRDDKPVIVAVDVWGSIYCFNTGGERQWKFSRSVKSGELRLPVLADLDGDGQREIFVTDSRGHLDVLEARGRLRLAVDATSYRLGVPAVGDVNGDGQTELIFGTEAGDVYCLDHLGNVMWSATLDGCFGRAFPLIADANPDGEYEVYFPTAFNNAHPGLFALEARTGQQLWKAPSVLQSYRSTMVADLDADGRNEILFGDKNSSLFCLDAAGGQRWSRQLQGRGIFFAPVVADLRGNGVATLFVVVRGAGAGGKSLYALDPNGQMLEGIPLPGGGGVSPVLCRFSGRREISLLTVSGSTLLCHRLRQEPGAAKLLWPGLRKDPWNSGFIPSAKPGQQPTTTSASAGHLKREHRDALAGSNEIQLPNRPPRAEFYSLRTVAPDGSVHVVLARSKPDRKKGPTGTFQTSVSGNYEVTSRWHDDRGAILGPEERFLYHLDKDGTRDARRLDTALAELAQHGRETPALASLSFRCQQSLQAAFDQARRTKNSADFDTWRWKADYSLALIRYCRGRQFDRPVLLHQLRNPWEQFDAADFFGRLDIAPNQISVSLLGNEYESAAIALTNPRHESTSFRLTCGPLVAGTNRAEARQVLEFREVLSVRPDGTGPLTEDPLPSLGEGQTVRLEAGETRKLWMTFRSRALTAGQYHASLQISPLTSLERPAEIPLTVEVWPIRLPERFTYRQCNWLYLASISDEALQEATLQDALEHGMNVFVIPSVSIQVNAIGGLGDANTAAHDKLVRKLRGRAFFLISGPVSVIWGAGTNPSTELRDKTFAEALRWYAGHMRSLGCDYEDYAIYLQDEPGLLGPDAGFDSFVALVKEFKAADPRVQLYANPAGGARPDMLRPLQDWIDVWAPDLHLVREQPAELQDIFKAARHYWHYEAPGDQRYLDPLGFYRLKPWVAFQLGMTGGGYWVYSSADFWSADPASANEYGTVYPTDRGPISTKRWEASREGIEDFELLWMLRQSARRSTSPAREEALQLLDEAVRFVTEGQEHVTDISRHVRPHTPDYEKWMGYRRRLIEMQLRLTSGH